MNTENIIEVDLSTVKSDVFITAFYQYDRGLKLRLVNVPENDDLSLWVDMCNSGDAVIKHDVLYSGEDVEIPRDLLQDGRNVQLWLYVKGPDYGKTILKIEVKITLRPSR